MKKCPFCAEQIQDEAIKCRFCGEFLDGSGRQKKPAQKWYHSNSALIVGLLCFGPLALPLAWMNPRYTVVTKIIITIVVIALTLWLGQLMGQMYHNLMKQVNELGIHQ